MALIDTYRNSKISKQNERAKLISDKAKEYLKIAVLSKKEIPPGMQLNELRQSARSIPNSKKLISPTVILP